MKYFFFFFLLILSRFGIAQTAAEEGIQHNLNDFGSAWNMHDPRAISMVFAEDADFTNVRGLSAHGRADIQQFHTKPFSTNFKDSNLKITGKKIRMINPDLAAVDVWWELTGALGPDGKSIPFRKGLMILIMALNGDKWLITVMHNMDLPNDR
jgi:uncharacterized protein (TIGR02246 family)